MTQTSQKINKEPQQLPAINRKQSQNSEIDQEVSRDQNNNVLPLTHEKKKRKHRKKPRKYSPQHYEQIRIKKLNVKLQSKWDSHFINDQIPDLYEKKKVNRKTLSKLGNTVNEKRSATALNSRMPGKKQPDLGLKKQTMPLPKIMNANKRKNQCNSGSKSFNIHVVTHKQSEPFVNKKKQDPLEAKLSQTSNHKRRKPSHQQKPQQIEQKSNVNIDEYKKTLTSLFQQKKFLHCHKQMLELFFQKLSKKSVKQIIDKEFELLKKNESTINKIIKAIENRQKFIQSLNTLIDKQPNDQKQIIQAVDNYRTSTLAVVQEILKWKQSWQSAYFEHFKKNIAFQLVYKTNNYLYTLASSVDQTIKKFHHQKERQNKIKTEKQLSQKQAQKTLPLTHQQVQKTQQPKQQTLREQIDTTKREPEQNIQEKIDTTNRKTLQKNITQPKEQKKPQQQVKIKQQQKTSKVKTQQVPLSKVQTVKNQKQQILLSDPFLISLFSIEKEDKNIILKIRACQLLLIQQQFNFLKK